MPVLRSLILVVATSWASTVLASPVLDRCFTALLASLQDGTAEEFIAREGKYSYPELAHKLFRTGTKASERLLAHPKFAPAFRKLIDIAQWVDSREGRKINERLAQKINEAELARAERMGKQLEAEFDLKKLWEHFEAGNQDADDQPTRRQVEASEKHVREYIKKAIAAGPSDVPPTDFSELMKQAALEEASEPHGKIGSFEPSFADILMPAYIPQPIDISGPDGVLDWMRLLTTTTIRKNTASKAFNAALKTANQKVAKHLMGPVTTRRFVEAGFIPTKPGHSGLVTWLLHLESGPIRDRMLSRCLPYPVLESELDSILEQSIRPLNFSSTDTAAIIKFSKAYFLVTLSNYLPEKPVLANSTTVAEHQKRVLKFMLQQMIYSLDKESAEALRLSSQNGHRSNGHEGNGQASEHQATLGHKGGLSRSERIRQYREAKEREQSQQMEQLLAGVPVREPDTAPVQTVPAVEQPVAALNIEQLIATHVPTEADAEELLGFLQDQLDQEDVPNVYAALRELLSSDNRRLTSQSTFDWKRIYIHNVYELRIRGKLHAIRIYFNIDSQAGPILLGGHYKIDEAEQRRMLEKVAKKWRAYLNG